MDQAVVEPAADISSPEARLANCVVQLRSLLDQSGSRPALAYESLTAAAQRSPTGIRRGQLLVFPPAPNPKHGVELRIVGVPVPAEEGVERFRVQVELFRLGPRARRVPRGQWTPSAFLRDETLAGHFFDERGIWILERPLAAAELPELVLAYRLMSQP